MRKLFSLFLVIISLLFIFPQQAIASSIVINEILPHSSSGNNDWIELYNTTSLDVDISGWEIEDSTSKVKTFASGTKIATSAAFLQVMVSNRLNNGGDTIKLKDNLGGIKDEKDYVQDPGIEVALGRYPDGGSSWGVLVSSSPNGSNSGFAPTTAPSPTSTHLTASISPTNTSLPSPTSLIKTSPTGRPKPTMSKILQKTVIPQSTITQEFVSPAETTPEVLGKSTEIVSKKKFSFILLLVLMGIGLGCLSVATYLSYRQLRSKRRSS